MTALLALVLSLHDDALAPLKAAYEAERAKPAAQRLATIDAVGALKTDEAEAFLEEVFDKEKDPAVRTRALEALWTTGTAKGVRKLAAVAQDAKAPTLLRAAALDPLVANRTREGLASAKSILREAGEMRIRGFVALRSYPIEDTQPSWRNALGDSDALVRGMALQALAPLKELKLQEQAKQALLDPAEEALVKYGAVAVLKAADGIANCRVLLLAAATPDPTLRRLLSDALGANTDDKAPDVIYQALRNADPNVRLVAARSLGTLKHDRAMDRLSEPLKDKSPEVRQAALEAVAERKDRRSEAILQREAQKSDEESSAAAIALLPLFPSEETRKLLLKLAVHFKTSVSIPALEALGELRIPEALPVFEKALKAKEWPVRVTAIRGLSKLKAKESVDLLVDRIAQEEGRMLAECADALRALTGKGFGYAPGAWKEWWTNHREAFAFDGAPAATGAPGSTTYHGIPVLSLRMVFCVDMSGSMSEAAEKDSRMEQAKRELGRTLGSVSKESYVNLIFFDDRIEPWHRQLVPIKQHLLVAQQIVARLEPRGRTNIFDALELAFQHKDVDTIYLLSDGEPTDGRVIEPGDILREVKRMNRLRQVVIHCVSFGPSPFMKGLAEQNGGQYVEIR